MQEPAQVVRLEFCNAIVELFHAIVLQQCTVCMNSDKTKIIKY